jgi:hypothetical protein
MDGGRQTCRPAKIRIASSGGPLPVSTSSHTAEAISSLFKDEKIVLAQKLLSPISHLQSLNLSGAPNRGESRLIAPNRG